MKITFKIILLTSLSYMLSSCSTMCGTIASIADKPIMCITILADSSMGASSLDENVSTIKQKLISGLRSEYLVSEEQWDGNNDGNVDGVLLKFETEIYTSKPHGLFGLGSSWQEKISFSILLFKAEGVGSFAKTESTVFERENDNYPWLSKDGDPENLNLEKKIFHQIESIIRGSV